MILGKKKKRCFTTNILNNPLMCVQMRAEEVLTRVVAISMEVKNDFKKSRLSGYNVFYKCIGKKEE